MSSKLTTLTLLVGLSVTSVAQATLLDRGSGLIYDDVLNITWLQNANQGAGSIYDNGSSSTDGRMTWSNAVLWAENLVYGGYDDWRLPFVVDTGTSGCNFAYSGSDCGYNVQTANSGTVYSELAYMYYVNLGLKSAYNPDGSVRIDFGIFGDGTTTSGQKDVGLIDNLQAGGYWSGTEYLPPSNFAWFFSTNHGDQNPGTRATGNFAWAVRPGDVTTVPEPTTLLLLGLGLAGLGVMRRRG